MFIHGLDISTSYATILAMVYNYTVGTVTRILLKEGEGGSLHKAVFYLRFTGKV